MLTVPSLPLLKSPPSGMTAHTRNAGTNARYGASLNTNRSLLSGIRSSLKNSLMPSASVCSRPFGPALSGPMRFCMNAMTLRSNHTISIVPTRPTTKMTTTLISTTRMAVKSRSPIEEWVEREHQRFSIRTSLTAAKQSMRSPTLGPGLLNGTQAVPRSTVVVGDRGEHHGGPEGR
jgi:hypothetical protein